MIRSHPALMYYDGQCRFCLQSVAALKKLDWLHRLRYVDLQKPEGFPPDGPALDHDRLLEEMHLVPPKKMEALTGFYAFRWMAWRLPLFWPLAPFLYLPGVPRWGQRLYLWIAKNRFRLVPCHGGLCEIPKPP